MALTGTFERTIDSKHRLAVPKPLKEALQVTATDELILAPGNEGCLSIYSQEGFDKFAQRLTRVSTGQANVRTYLRLLYARAERVVLDKQTRVRIPDRLMNHASLNHEAIIIGVNDHAEIWDRNQWEQFLSANTAQFDDLTSEALDSFLVEPPMDG